MGNVDLVPSAWFLIFGELFLEFILEYFTNTDWTGYVMVASGFQTTNGNQLVIRWGGGV